MPRLELNLQIIADVSLAIRAAGFAVPKAGASEYAFR